MKLRPVWTRWPMMPVVLSWAALTVVAIVCVMVFAVRLASRAINNEVNDGVRSTASAGASAVENELRALSEVLESFARRPSLVSAVASGNVPAASNVHLEAILDISSDFVAVGLADPEGNFLNVLPENPAVIGKNFSYRDWFRGVKQTGRPYVSEAFESATRGRPEVVAIAAPIRVHDSDPSVGILVVGYSLDALQRFTRTFADSQSIALTITDQRGVVIAAPHSEAVHLQPPVDNPLVRSALAGSVMVAMHDSPDGPVLAACVPVQPYGWTVMASLPEDVALAGVVQLRSSIYFMTMIAVAALAIGLILVLIALRGRRQAEDELWRQRAFLDSVLENIPDMVIVKDAVKLEILLVNKAGEELLGRPRSELLGKTLEAALPDAQAWVIEAVDRRLLGGDESAATLRETFVTKRGGTRMLQTQRMVIRCDDGVPRYLLAIAEDITALVAIEDQLRQALAEAEFANVAKSNFLSRMSHELRTPLNAILGFAQVLEMDRISNDQKESVSQILKGGRHLLELINEVLDLARIEAGHLTISIEPVNAGAIVDDVVELLRPLAAQRDIQVTAQPAPHFVLADAQRLKQVFLNLVANAIKYNVLAGRVQVSFDTNDPDVVQIHVRDTGPGIPPAQFENLFQPFMRLEADRDRVEGTGLGLALSKRLVEAMGGSLRVHSQTGAGSTFTVALQPAANPAADVGETPPVRPPAARNRQQPIILYIEDNPSNLLLLERVLAGRTDITLMAAMQGRLGIDFARQHQPQLILLDIHLPDMDGHEVLADLKSHPKTQDIPVVVVSADATEPQIRRMMAAGARAYLTKPFNVKRLLELIAQSLSESIPGS